MAIFSSHANVVSRSQGRCSVAAAAYRSGTKLVDERQGMTFDYTNKRGVAHSEIMAPEHAPQWIKDREKLWNAIEQIEKRKDAQLAREVTIALPVELRQDEWVALLREYCQINYINKGMIADFNIHNDNPNNPHAHIMLTLREITPEGFGNKVREWNTPELIINQRKSLEELTNQALYKAGIDQRIDCRSLAEKGSTQTPNLHLGPAAHHALQRGESNLARTQSALEILRINGDNIIKNPSIGLRQLSEKSATFSDHNIYKYANSNCANYDQFKAIVTAIKGSDQLVTLGQNDNNKTVYTSKEMIKLEHSMLNHVYELEAKAGHAVSPSVLNEISKSRNLTPGQQKALEYVTSPGDFKAMVGFAGTGKSYLMGCAKEIWEAHGFRVRGMALSGIAAEGLEQGSKIQSRTIDSHLFRWEAGEDPLNKNDILVVDEAGMLDTPKSEALLAYANLAHAKVVVVGDDEQLPAVGCGTPFRACVERLGAVSLCEIIRQCDPNNPEKTRQMRSATLELETQKTSQALERYALMGAVISSRNKEEAISKIVDNWYAYQKTYPDKSQMIMAHTRVEVKALNEAIRQRKIESQEIQPGKTFDVNLNRDDKTMIEQRAFSEGDTILFFTNDNRLGVKNGRRGTIEKIQGDNFSVKLDGKDGKSVQFDIGQYNHIDHGYAGTIYKNQGVTVDKAYALVSQHWNRFLSCVGLTRHRLEVEIHTTEDCFKSFNQMTETMGRENVKEMALDYAHNRGIEPQDYANFDPRILGKSQREFALERLEERRLSEDNNGTTFQFLKPGQEFSGFIDKMITLGNGSERGIIKDKDDTYKILPDATETKALEGKFVTASLGSDGKLNSLTTLHVSEDSKIHSKEHIFKTADDNFSKSDQTKNHKGHEISESFFFATPMIGREVEIDFERNF